MFALVVPTVMAALAPGLSALVFWRFVQGLVLPPIFAIVVAYIGEEWPRREAISVTGIYTSATSFGGFFGRFITGVVADASNWRVAFLTLAILTFALALIVTLTLPREHRFVRSAGLRVAFAQMLRHCRNRRLVATYGVGFGVLFTFVATFTYVNFLLAAPPFGLSPTFLGLIFVVYLGGSVRTPPAGHARHRRVDLRPLAHAGAMASGDPRRVGDQRDERHSLSGRLHRRRRGLRRAGTLLGGRPLRQLLLCRRQLWRRAAWAYLEHRTLARLHRHGGGRTRLDGLGGLAVLGRSQGRKRDGFVIAGAVNDANAPSSGHCARHRRANASNPEALYQENAEGRP
jgi:hypothetical protein